MPYDINHDFKPGDTAALSAVLVADEFTLAGLINKDIGNSILGGGGKGRSIDVKIPAALVAHGRGIDDTTNKIILDTLTERTVSLTTGVHAYNAVALGEGDRNLDIKDFGKQVLKPQAEAVAAYCNDAVLDMLIAETVTDLGATYDPANPAKFFTALRAALRARGLPSSGLRALTGTAVYADLLDSKAFEDVSASGSTAALREGTVGKVRGFDTVENFDIDENDIMVFHRDAFTLGLRAPSAPTGAPYAATVSEAGVPLRHIMDYDTDYTADRSVLSTFVGVAKMPLYKVVRTRDVGMQGDVIAVDNPEDGDTLAEVANFVPGSASVVEVAGGAVIRVNTGA